MSYGSSSFVFCSLEDNALESFSHFSFCENGSKDTRIQFILDIKLGDLRCSLLQKINLPSNLSLDGSEISFFNQTLLILVFDITQLTVQKFELNSLVLDCPKDSWNQIIKFRINVVNSFI